MKPLRLLSAGTVLIALLACGNPFDGPTRGDRENGTLIVHMGSNARTVVHDFSADVDSVDIVLSSREGYDSLSGTITLPDSSCTFEAVAAGSWDISVTAKKEGAAIGAGTILNRMIASGTTAEVTVPVDFPPGSGTGDMSLTVQYPSDTGIDYVEGTIGNLTIVPQPELAGSDYQATFSASGLPAGYDQDLLLTFRRGGASGTSAGHFLESVNIWSGFTSDRWINSSGELVSVRLFTANEFLDNTSRLADLQLSAGTITFDPDTLAYDAVSEVDENTITPTAAVSGQYIRYRLNGGSWNEISTGTTSAPMTLGLETNSIEISVSAPDRESTRTYVVTVRKGHRVTYNGNGSSQGGVPLDQAIYIQGQSVIAEYPGSLAAEGYDFSSWNTAPAGTGSAIEPGQSFVMSNSSVTLYAQWQVLTPTFSLPGGTYASGQTVDISCGTAGAVIRYTTDGTDPTPTHGTVGTSVVIDSTASLKALAYETDHPQSVVAQVDYVITSILTVGFTMLYPGSQVISFASTDVIVPRGQTLVLNTTNSTLAALSGWKWYVNVVQDTTQTSSTFSWSTTGLQPGQYIVSVTVVYEGVKYSGSLRATVTF
ncbi:MAG TPA: chitobiase/beta-hexosaminidase C-terminal domain-containing protein [Spirochaetia bacterium]|nr:chitobiase/beta-hexosaminidase C-terminal domain-containing protein [Spirochaetia bacterium]